MSAFLKLRWDISFTIQNASLSYDYIYDVYDVSHVYAEEG